jgi:hypothetical protein
MALQKWFTTAGVPPSAPVTVGDINTDTTNNRVYVAKDTGASSDWQLMIQNTSELTIDADILTGGYRTKFLSVNDVTAVVTNGAASVSKEYATNDINLNGYDFDAATDEFVQWNFVMPDSWNGGNIRAKIYWTDAVTAGTGDVIWAVKGGALSDDDVIDTALGTAQTITDTFIASGDMHITSTTPAITLAGTPQDGDFICLQVYRDADAAGDTYTQDARPIGVNIQYQEKTTAPAVWS